MRQGTERHREKERERERDTHRHTDARDQYAFRVVYDSHEM